MGWDKHPSNRENNLLIVPDVFEEKVSPGPGGIQHTAAAAQQDNGNDRNDDDISVVSGRLGFFRGDEIFIHVSSPA
jgi:hypothetical protein